MRLPTLETLALFANHHHPYAHSATYVSVKLMWICAFMLLGTVNGGITVGEVVGKKTEEVGSNPHSIRTQPTPPRTTTQPN